MASLTPAITQEVASDGLAQPGRVLAFISIAIAITMAVLDASIVNVALPAIGHDLGSTPENSIWIVNAYQITITVLLLPFAALGDSLGYKRVYCAGLALFTGASFCCAAAHTLTGLALARVLHGVGAAGVMSVDIALVRFIYPRAKLGAGVGYVSMVVASSSVAGPSVASAILSIADWHGLFLVNVPLGLLALLIGARALPVTAASGKKFDLTSVVLNAVTFGLLISGLSSFAEARATLRAVLMVSGGLLMGIVFVVREGRLATPILPMDLLRLRLFALSLLTSICAFAAQAMACIALPFYFVRMLGRSETEIGLLMTPWPLLTAATAPLAGWLSDRLAPHKLGSLGLLALACGLASLIFLGESPSALDIGFRLGICGLGFGLFQSPNNRVIMGSAPAGRSGGAAGFSSMGRLLGQSLGAVVVALAFGLVRTRQTTVVMAAGVVVAVLGACSSALRRSPH